MPVLNPSPSIPQPLPGRPLSRDVFLLILRSALILRETRFARQAALAWLTAFPGDLPVNLMYAQALANDGRPDQALLLAADLCETDPEFTEAIELLARLQQEQNHPKSVDTLGNMLALGGKASLMQKGDTGQTIVTWSRLLGQARVYLERGDLAQAEQVMHQTLASKPSSPLVAATHLRILQAQAAAKHTPPQALYSLADFYHENWPNCLQCSLILADVLMDGGESEKAVALLHHAAGRDVTAQVATRLWGTNHPYRVLWPDLLEIELDIPIPASIAAALGWNRLPVGSPSSVNQMLAATRERPSPESEAGAAKEGRDGLSRHSSQFVSRTPSGEPQREAREATPAPESGHGDEEQNIPIFTSVPESLRSVQSELERVAARLNRSSLVRSEGRLPVYVVMTSYHGLESIYGTENLAALEAEMRRLVEAIQARRDWQAMLFYADKGISIQGNRTETLVHPARPKDPWALKLALADLDIALGHKGEMIGAVLIVGGPEVVPFHHLPNPVDDSDADVPSDNPYTTRDENYFIPEWPVGRLPGGARRGSADPEPLLKMLRMLSARHGEQAKHRRTTAWYQHWWAHLSGWMKRQYPGVRRKRNSFGYTAAIWRQASLSVFRPIGQPGSMLVSPPVQAAPVPVSDSGRSSAEQAKARLRVAVRRSGLRKQKSVLVPSTKLAYFNLHGLEDAVEWYGQSDPSEGREGSVNGEPDYPVALRPQDIVNGGRAPQVVFSEACYGAHILDKNVDEALALKFLQSGSQVIVGSTCTAYGSVNTPLIAADFLGHGFWNYLRKGIPAGEALRRAKISLAQEMHQRQGYLDGEDQKTLISFVLYGDPLAQPLGGETGPKAILRSLKPPERVQTVCDRSRPNESDRMIPPEVLAHVKSVVEQYLPGMADAQLTINQEHAKCHQAGHECPTSQLGVSELPSQDPDRRLIILSKQVLGETHLHRHYARITLDAENRVVKLVVSR